MKTTVCTYNIKWFEYQFNPDNTLKTLGSSKKDKELKKQRDGIIASLNAIKPDILGIVEAPNTTTTVGIQSCVEKLNNFFAAMGWANYQAIVGFISAGRQELALVYNTTKFSASHVPGGSAGSKSNPPFNEEYYYDTDDDDIKEVYEFYRPPLEVEFTSLTSGEKLNVILVHTKSKGIFSSMDFMRLERESIKNRKKLFAECSWIRNRAEEWIDSGKRVLVMGDVNDGPGFDFYESKFGKSAIEILIGDLFDHKHLLMHFGGRPKWSISGWQPSTTRFRDPITRSLVNAQIDHVLVSENIVFTPNSYKIWNPSELDEAKPLKDELKNASDHYPVTVEVDF